MAAGLAAGFGPQARAGADDAAVVARFHGFAYRGIDEPGWPPLETLATGQFRNPILSGFHPDPSICRVGSDHYLVTSSFACFPGLPIHHSRDLVNWRLVGHAIDRATQLDYRGLGISRGLFAPALSHHQGLFHLVCTMVGAGGNFLITARDPAGPWSDPVWLDVDGIDPSLFFDDDGRAWLLNNGPPPGAPRYDGHRAIWIQAFDVQRHALVGPRHLLVDGGADPATNPVWIEGPHLFRRGEWLYLCAAEGGTSVNHAQVIFRGRDPTGPFVAYPDNPILTQRGLDDRVPGAVSCAGHAQLFVGPDDGWWATFLACRPDLHGRWHTGRETFLLPVHWRDDGWPVILPHGERVPCVLPSPLGAAMQAGYDDEAWLALRGPCADWARFDAMSIRLEPRRDTLAERGRPAYLARRVAHRAFTLHACIERPPDRASAGIALFQSEAQHVYAFVESHGDAWRLGLERVDRGQREVWREPVPIDAGALWLELRCDGEWLSFATRPAPSRTFPIDTHPVNAVPGERGWQRHEARVPAAMLSVQAAGGGLHFTGLLAGVHARQEAMHG